MGILQPFENRISYCSCLYHFSIIVLNCSDGLVFILFQVQLVLFNVMQWCQWKRIENFSKINSMVIGPIKLVSPRHFILKCLYQTITVGGHYICVSGLLIFKTSSYVLFYWISKLYRKCGIFFPSYLYIFMMKNKMGMQK